MTAARVREAWDEEETPAPKAAALGWAAIAEEARRRIFRREWAPGETIPGEVELAREFGVSRVTVNRALRVLAEEGVLDRRRKAGTRVAERPVRRATFSIRLIRDEIEGLGKRYAYEGLSWSVEPVSTEIGRRMAIRREPAVLRILAIHRADGVPWVWEERFINLRTVPEAERVDWRAESPNEWLLKRVPYTYAEVSVGAEGAWADEAAALGCAEGAPLLSLERTTWAGDVSVTFVRLLYAPGHRMWSRL